MKNYYEILEVDTKASKEVIDKAFKVLAKRYHPDMQEENKKEWAEAKFKEINEAYETLSNLDKKEKYDAELEYEEHNRYVDLLMQKEDLEILVKELQDKLNQYTNATNTTVNSNINPINNTNYYNVAANPNTKNSTYSRISSIK